MHQYLYLQIWMWLREWWAFLVILVTCTCLIPFFLQRITTMAERFVNFLQIRNTIYWLREYRAPHSLLVRCIRGVMGRRMPSTLEAKLNLMEAYRAVQTATATAFVLFSDSVNSFRFKFGSSLFNVVKRALLADQVVTLGQLLRFRKFCQCCSKFVIKSIYQLLIFPYWGNSSLWHTIKYMIFGGVSFDPFIDSALRGASSFQLLCDGIGSAFGIKN